MLSNHNNTGTSKNGADPYFVLHVPANLDLETLLKKHNKKSRSLHSYAYLCHAILGGYLDNVKLSCNDYVRLDSRILRRMLSRKKATEVINDLLTWRVIERSNNYSVSTATKPGSCKGYRFTKKFREEVKWIRLHNRPMWKKLQSINDKQKDIQRSMLGSDHTLAFLQRQLQKLKLDLPSAYKQVLSLDHRRLHLSANSNSKGHYYSKSLFITPVITPRLPSSISISIPIPIHTTFSLPTPLPPSYVVSFSNFIILHRLNTFHRASNGEIYWEFKSDRKTGRLFTNLTNLKRTFRRHLYLESQEKLVMVDVGECQPFMFSIILLKRATAIWGEHLPTDVRHYIQLTSKRSFYRFIMDKCGVPEGEREAFKKIIFSSIFYCSKWTAENADNKPGSTFIRCFPNVYRILTECKEGSRSLLPNQLMREESEIILRDVCARIAGYGDEEFFVATIHDAIVTTTGRAKQVKSLIENAFWTRSGHIPTVKIEPLNFDDDTQMRA